MQRPLTPKEITWISKSDHRFTALKYNTVKVYCRQLLNDKRGRRIDQPFRGHYKVTETTYGVGKQPPVRVHDLRLVWEVDVKKRVCELHEVVGDVKLDVTVGSKRGKVSAMVACDEGMDYNTVAFVVDKIRRLAWEEGGVNLDPRECVVCCEFNEDYTEYRIDGLKCATVRSFLGDLERVYNKEDVLRSEVKVSETSLPAVFTMLKGGVTTYHVFQAQMMILQETRKLFHEMKRIADRLDGQRRLR